MGQHLENGVLVEDHPEMGKITHHLLFGRSAVFDFKNNVWVFEGKTYADLEEIRAIAN